MQVMRQKAEQAGNLKTTQQQVVTTQGSTIVVEPAEPDVVYVPAYDPWIVYGPPIVAWPGWYPYPGIWFAGPYLSFGVGFGIGWFGGFGWGWHHWGFDWHNHYVVYNHARYFRIAQRFTTATCITEAGAEEGKRSAAAGGRQRGLRRAVVIVLENAATFTTGRGLRPGRSKETVARRADMLSHTGRAT